MPTEEATSLLGDRVASVSRRLTVRVVALGAVAGAVAGAAVAIALAPPPSVRVGLTLMGAAAGAALANRFAQRAELADGTAWLDRRAGRLELIASGVAVADGRARRTQLASAVIGAATERARAAGRPSPLPLAAAIAVIVVLAGVTWSRPRAEPARTPAAATSTTQPPPAMVVARDGGDRGASSSDHDPRQSDAVTIAPSAGDERTHGDATPGAHATLAGRGADTSGIGGSAGATIDRDATITPATATTQLDISAPRAGASAEVNAVPPRYRALVAAYLEAR